MKRVGGVSLAVVLAGVVLAGCSGSSGDGARPEPSESLRLSVGPGGPSVDPSPTFPDSPEGDLDRKAAAQGWMVDAMYGSPSQYVADICESMTNQKRFGNSPGDWLVENQKPDASEREVLTAGMPSLCPKWSKTVLDALGGGYAETFADGLHTVGSADQGEDDDAIPAGTYRTTGRVEDCYWERTTEGGDIIDNAMVTSGLVTVTVRPSDGSLTTKNCGTWRAVK